MTGMEILNTVTNLLRSYSATIYTLICVLMVGLWVYLIITTGPAGTLLASPAALLALILRKLDRIEKRR